MIQALSVDQKWAGAPFAAMLRRNQLEDCSKSDSVLRMELVLVSSNSKVKQVKYLSIVLQVMYGSTCSLVITYLCIYKLWPCSKEMILITILHVLMLISEQSSGLQLVV